MNVSMGPRTLQRRMENALNDGERGLAAELQVQFYTGVNPTGGRWPLVEFSEQELFAAEHRVANNKRVAEQLLRVDQG